MKNEEPEIISDNLLKTLMKSICSAILVFITSLFLIPIILGSIFNFASDDGILICLYFGIMFSIFFCTNTILNELRARK